MKLLIKEKQTEFKLRLENKLYGPKKITKIVKVPEKSLNLGKKSMVVETNRKRKAD